MSAALRLRRCAPCDGAQNGWTPLHAASNSGRLKVVRLLLERGADKEADDNVRHCALSYIEVTQSHFAVNAVLTVHGATCDRA